MVPFEKWETVHSMFILKENGNYKLNQQRTLHKLQSRLNMLRRSYQAKRMMNNMEKYKSLDDAQFGGRTGQMPIDPVLIKVLTLEIAHLQGSNVAIADCDTKACYD